MTTIYSAQWVLPISLAPIEDGAVAIDGDIIKAVDQRARLVEKFPSARLEQFGEAAILPGFVNTHSHLELTAMRGLLDQELTDFPAWLKKLTVARLERLTPEDLYVSAAWGACEAARAGVTFVGDASSVALESMRALLDVGLRGTVFQESFGPDPQRVVESVATLKREVVRLRTLETPLVRAGVSPHAPYTVCAPQLRAISEFAQTEDLPLMMHAAESVAEDLLLREGCGPFAAGLAARGIDWTRTGLSSIQYLEQTGILASRPLLAHCINVDDKDIETMVRTGTRVAHCPKSNARFGHRRAPLAKFLAQKVTVGLGSDSVASNNNCDVLVEARFAALVAQVQGIDGAEGIVNANVALGLATRGGAGAMGLAEMTGELKPGFQADLTVVSLDGVHQLPSYDPVGTLVYASSGRDVIMTMVAGREIYRDGRITTVDEDELRKKIEEIAIKLRA